MADDLESAFIGLGQRASPLPVQRGRAPITIDVEATDQLASYPRVSELATKRWGHCGDCDNDHSLPSNENPMETLDSSPRMPLRRSRIPSSLLSGSVDRISLDRRILTNPHDHRSLGRVTHEHRWQMPSPPPPPPTRTRGIPNAHKDSSHETRKRKSFGAPRRSACLPGVSHLRPS